MSSLLDLIRNPIILSVAGSLLYGLQNYIEKLIFQHPGGDVNKYYLLRNLIISWAFMILLIFMHVLESKYVSLKNVMNTISWESFLNNRFLLGMTLLASFFVLTSSYLAYIGIKFNPISSFVPLFTLVYLITTLMFGIGFLGEKINRIQAVGIILAVIAIILIEYPKASTAS